MKDLEKMVEKNLKKKNKKDKKKLYKFKGSMTKSLFTYLLIVLNYYLNLIIKKIDNSIIKWDDKRTEKIITHWLEKSLIKDKNGDLVDWCNTWYLYFKNYNNLIDKRYCEKYNKDILQYFKNEFEIDGYIKIIKEEEDKDCISIKFQKEVK